MLWGSSSNVQNYLTLTSIYYHSPTPPAIPTSDTVIADTGSRGLYLFTDAPHHNHNPYAPPIIVGTAIGHT